MNNMQIERAIRQVRFSTNPWTPVEKALVILSARQNKTQEFLDALYTDLSQSPVLTDGNTDYKHISDLTETLVQAIAFIDEMRESAL